MIRMPLMETAILEDIVQLDRQITLQLNALSTPGPDAAWQFLSGQVIWYVVCIAMLVYLFLRLGWKRGLVALCACLLTFALCDQSARLVKYAVERLRPCWDEEMLAAGLQVLEGKGGNFGFFSAHSANAAGLALCSFLCLRSDAARRYQGYAWLAFSLAFLIGMSRVFVGKHFLGDVLAGFCVGLLFGWLLGLLARRWMGRIPMTSIRLPRQSGRPDRR